MDLAPGSYRFEFTLTSSDCGERRDVQTVRRTVAFRARR
jgi:hypothetical protein